jgi:RHS repeat-associated protein
MLMPGRSYNSAEYRFGFNGKEKDDEVKGSGAQYDYGFRIYDPRLGKFLSVDPLQKKFPFYSPYHFAGNSPIANVDLDGREPNWFMIPIYWELAKAKIKKWINDSGDELSGGINEYARGANGGYSDEHLPDQVNTMRNTYHQVHGAAVVADNLITKPGEFAAESAGSIPGVDVVSDPLLATYFGAKGDYASASAYTAAAAFPFVSGFVLKNAGKGLQYALKATDLDLRGSTVVFRDALEAAFEKTGVKKSEFEITKWAKNKEGKSVPVEYRAKGGAEVSIDAAHDWSNGPSGPDAPHIGWQTGGKGKNQQSGHIILDDVPANRSTKKE